MQEVKEEEMNEPESNNGSESTQENVGSSEDSAEEAAAGEKPPQINEYVKSNDIAATGEFSGFQNKLFAKQTDNGTWLLRWCVEKQSEKDFIGLCYEGVTFRTMDYRTQRPMQVDFFEDHPSRMYQRSREQLPPMRGRGAPARRNPGRKSYQGERSQTHRQVKSTTFQDGDLSSALMKKLYPGSKDVQPAADRLEAVNTMKAITLTITTRAIGFSTINIFSALFEFNHVPVNGNIYQFYRVALTMIEVKVKIVQRGLTAIQANEEDYAASHLNKEYVIATKGAVVVPDQLSTIINSVGKVKIHDKLYVPKIGRTNVGRNNLFIPQPEQLTLSNLRQTVEALNNPLTPVEFRRRFYANNPIPGAIWHGGPDNPILNNPDEIMPDEYTVTDLNDDMSAMRAKMNFLNKKAPKYFTKPPDYEAEGDKAMLVCNSMSGMRVINRNPGEDLLQYYTRIKVEGNVSDFYNIECLTTAEQIQGNIGLLGESALGSLKYPTYLLRDERACCQYSNLSYKAAMNIRYT